MKPLLCCTALACLSLCFAPAARANLDQDLDGYNDVWELFYNASALAPGADEDGDGRTNLQESQAGTDPRDPGSRFVVNSIAISGSAVTVTFPTVLGKKYCIQGSTDLVNWNDETPYVPGTGGQMQAVGSTGAGEAKKFFRASALDMDTDGDGATDWEERTAGYDPTVAQSAVPGQSDLVSLTNAVNATTSTITVTATDGQAYETNATNGQPHAGTLRISRAGKLTAVTVHYSFSGRPVSGVDYLPITGAGSVTLGFGVNTADIAITPIADTVLEVPETLTLTITPDAGYAIGTPSSAGVRIDDAQNQTETLFFAPLGAVTGASTTASGFSTIWLSADHTSLRVSASFSGLTSAQTAVHLHLHPSSLNLFSLPLGQFQNVVWTLPANGVGTLTSDQAILDQLVAGNIYLNIHSTTYGSGEIEGNFAETAGSITFTPPAYPGPAPTYTGEAYNTDIRRFISQSTFGQTDALFSQVSADGISGWITRQMDTAQTPQTNFKDWVKAADNWLVSNSIAAGGSANYQPFFQSLIHGWWNLAQSAPDQLRQRVAFALSEIFVVSINNTTVRNRHYGTADYWDMLARNSFGNFRTLLEDVSIHPIMANYLSMIKNEPYNAATGVSPDENYSREVMQLFSIGLVELHPDGSLKLDATNALPTATYDNNDITELATVFTGWSFSKSQSGGSVLPASWNNNGPITDNNNFNSGGGQPYAQAAFYYPLKMFPAKHDTRAKTIVGGVNIPAGQTGEADMDSAMDALFNHPNTGPFIARRLIQRLVTSNPSRGYVYRVAQTFANNGSGVRGDMAAVVRAIFTDYEARSQDVIGQAGYGKMREPLLRGTQFLRAQGATSGIAMADIVTNASGWNASYVVPYPAGTKMLRISTFNDPFGQKPIAAPSVFNWFHPEYVFSGALSAAGLVAPEFEITNETQVVNLANYFSTLFWTSTGSANADMGQAGDSAPNYSTPQARITVNVTGAETALASGGTAGLLDYLEKAYVHGPLNASVRTAIETAVNNTVAQTFPTSSATREKAKTALYLLLTSPDYTIQR